jgi:hypothetical protein
MVWVDDLNFISFENIIYAFDGMGDISWVSVETFPCSVKEATASNLGRAGCQMMPVGCVGPLSPTRHPSVSMLCPALGVACQHQERLLGTILQ